MIHSVQFSLWWLITCVPSFIFQTFFAPRKATFSILFIENANIISNVFMQTNEILLINLMGSKWLISSRNEIFPRESQFFLVFFFFFFTIPFPIPINTRVVTQSRSKTFDLDLFWFVAGSFRGHGWVKMYSRILCGTMFNVTMRTVFFVEKIVFFFWENAKLNMTKTWIIYLHIYIYIYIYVYVVDFKIGPNFVRLWIKIWFKSWIKN